jgi:RecG-like helicase
MLLREISVPVSRVRGVGPAAAERLAALGILTVGDLLSHWPRSWDDRTEEIPLSAWDGGRRVHAAVTVLAHDWFGFGRMRTLKIAIEDAEGTRAELACFNRPFLANSFPVGSRAVVTGSFQWKYGGLQSSAFELEARARRAVPSCRSIPLRPASPKPDAKDRRARPRRVRARNRLGASRAVRAERALPRRARSCA